ALEIEGYAFATPQLARMGTKLGRRPLPVHGCLAKEAECHFLFNPAGTTRLTSSCDTAKSAFRAIRELSERGGSDGFEHPSWSADHPDYVSGFSARCRANRS